MLKIMNNSPDNYDLSKSMNQKRQSLTQLSNNRLSLSHPNKLELFKSNNDVNKLSKPKLHSHSANRVTNSDNASGSDNDSLRQASSKFTQNSDLSFNKNNESKKNLDTDRVNNSVSSKVNKNFLNRMKKKHKYKISANISGTKFDIIRNVLDSIGCKIASDDNFDCNLIWDDTRVSVEGVSELKSFQRFNHFPAMSEISRKDALAKNILKICKILPHEFNFVPKTWIMPGDYSNLLMYANESKKLQQKKTYIMKPSNGAMGNGIRLFRNVEKISPSENFIIQEYIPNPYLLDGFKFDLRIYALVTSCDPLRAFIFNNGLVRLGTEEYQEPNESNIDHLYMHLTNYSVNKRNKSFYDEGDPNGETGTKRSLKYLFDYFRRNNIDSSKIWKNIQDIILKTLLVAEPYLFHTYKMCRPGQIPGTESVCYEVLGFDILLDDKLKPWVIEVNRSPSFGTNSQIDFDIKARLLIDTFELLHLRSTDRQRSQQMEKIETKKRLYNLNSSRNEFNSFEQKVLFPTGSLNSGLSASNSNNNSNSNLNAIRKIKSKEKRKMELIDQIKLLRREQKRQDFENRNLGNFSRLFPIDDKYDMDYYLNILNTAFNIFYPIGKHVQWKKTYERIREDELLYELAECDDELYDGYDCDQYKKLNEYLKDDYIISDTDDENQSNSDNEENEYHYSRHYDSVNQHHKQKQHLNLVTDKANEIRSSSVDSFSFRNEDIRKEHNKEPNLKSGKRISIKSLVETENIKQNRVNTLLKSVMDTKVSKPLGRRSTELEHKVSDINNFNKNEQRELLNQMRRHQNKQNLTGTNNLVPVKSREITEEQEDLSNHNISTLTVACLKLLNQLEIKFPGKTNLQTRNILQKIYSKIHHYKPKLVDYWMIKLDDGKRAKIINIVKSNVIVILQKVFMVDAVDNLRLYKIFIKLFNRLLWMHGQGLWNCFESSNSTWESIFNKSSFQITESELKCCYRVVELCKDCVIIVYQYAFENKQNYEKRDSFWNQNSKHPTTSLTNSSLNLTKK